MKNRIFLMLLLLLAAPFSLLSVNISGRVVDEKGKALSYVSLYLKKAPETGTITDVNGRFSLEVANTRDSLIVALVGYETVVVNLHKINGDKTMKITMKEQPVMLNEIVVSVQKNKTKKKSKKEERAEIQAVLKKVYDRIFVDFPSINVKYDVVSDLTAMSNNQVVLFDEWIGDIVELRDFRGVTDSIQMKMDLDKRYVNDEFKSSINQYNPNDYSKRDRKLVDKVDVQKMKKIQVHKIAWELDVQQLFYRYMSDKRHWSMVEKDGNTIVLTLTLTNKLPGIYKLVRKLVYAVDKSTYSIKTISERVSADVNIPFGYKMTSAELAILNAFVLDREGFEKYCLKGFQGTSCRNNIFERKGNQLVVAEKNFTASGHIVDNKDNKVNFSSKIKTRVLSVQTSGVKPYSESQLKGGTIRQVSTPQ